MKRCRECGQILPDDSFYADRQKRDGLSTYCKVCKAEMQRARWYAKRFAVAPEGPEAIAYRPVEQWREVLTTRQLAQIIGCNKITANTILYRPYELIDGPYEVNDALIERVREAVR